MRRIAWNSLLIAAACAAAVSACGSSGEKQSPDARELPLAPGLHAVLSLEICEAYDLCRRQLLLEGPAGSSDAALSSAEQRRLRDLGWEALPSANHYSLGLGKRTGGATRELDAYMYSERVLASRFTRRVCRRIGFDRGFVHPDFGPDDQRTPYVVKCAALSNVRRHRPGVVVELSYEHVDRAITSPG